jgi:hypothetical protein
MTETSTKEKTQQMTREQLLDIRSSIALASKHNHTSSFKMFKENWFAEEKKGHPVYVIRFGLGENQFGNTIGGHINELACATQARSHIVVIPLPYNRDYLDEFGRNEGFMDALSTVYVHPNPAPSSEI